MIAVKAHFDGKVIVPDEPVDLPSGQQLVVHLQPIPNGTEPQSLLDWMVENAVDDPSLPTDAAHQHDYYLYGTPKKAP